MKRLRRASPVVVFRTEAPPGRLIGHAWGSFDVADLEEGWRRSPLDPADVELLARAGQVCGADAMLGHTPADGPAANLRLLTFDTND